MPNQDGAHAEQLIKSLQEKANPKRAFNLAWFFKTGPGQYGEGDRFLGLTVPEVRQIAKLYQNLPLMEAEQALQSEWHEVRLAVLIIWVKQFQKADLPGRMQLYHTYLKHTDRINNWDLVDLSAPRLVGGYWYGHLTEGERVVELKRLAGSESLWERRIAVLGCFGGIALEQYSEALLAATLLLHDQHDLIHKAVGWMLREIGKRDPGLEKGFLDQHAASMPRTMLRYAIEKFSPPERTKYLNCKKQAN